ncbi:uncharacterized protein F4822DRAFT_182121 [Hypoxylon trugodes]|uniref:uncharacterized protein n=1 Tax=Hypoxylon trugodes TaxID=326681 RepID=UPI00219D9EB3|nr:uncharacterized protein F4822DRAFT_182121 [Hypoxylon trugodes]KAI1391329.1 hypothetical protein F4822DRAFT_182121 [Hypoxylon trugodes]
MQKSKHKQKSSRPWSEHKWSEPKWHDQYQQWYLEREDRNGTIEYKWVEPNSPSTQDQSIPRSDHTIDDLAGGVQNLSVNQGVYDSGQSFDYGNHHAATVDHASYTLDTRQPQDSSYIDHVQTQQPNDKGKGKLPEVEQLNQYGNTSLGSNPSQVSDGVPLTTNNYNQGTQPQYTNPGYMAVDGTTAHASINSVEPQVNNYEPEETQSLDEDAYNEAIRRSRNEYYGTQTAGEPSYSASIAGTASTSSSWPTAAVDPNAYELNPPLVNGEDVQTPRGGSPVPVAIPAAPSYSNYIQGTPGEEEVLDSRYRVEHSGRFQPGEVFKILWSEPLGQVGQAGGDDPISDITKRRTAGGNKFYIGFRRFIIVTTDESHHSTCVPILTYDRRGCLKKGVRPNKHGIIYMAGTKPKLLKNEPELGFPPVALQVYAEGEMLARESRVNYSKLVTIEHNVKVFFIGSITGDDFDNVRYAVNECWNKKMHRSSRKTRR